MFGRSEFTKSLPPKLNAKINPRLKPSITNINPNNDNNNINPDQDQSNINFHNN